MHEFEGDEARRSRERALLDQVEVQESRIHGQGVFARRLLRPGEWIGRFEGSPTLEDGTYVLWVFDDEGQEVGIRGRNALRFLNHGEPPNAEFEGAELFVLRDVPPGAEILIDYGEAWKSEDEPPTCHGTDGAKEESNEEWNR